MNARRQVWVAEVRFAASVERKIEAKHSVTRAQVEEAVLHRRLHHARWHTHPRYGDRLIIRERLPGRQHDLIVILGVIDEEEGVWACRTAMWDQ